MDNVAAPLEGPLASEDLQIFLVAVDSEPEDALEFLDEVGVTAPCLLDPVGETFHSYPKDQVEDGSASYPLWVVIDRDGVIAYIGSEADYSALLAAAAAALAAGG